MTNYTNLLTTFSGISLLFLLISSFNKKNIKEPFLGMPYSASVKRIREYVNPATGQVHSAPASAIYNENVQLPVSRSMVQGNMGSIAQASPFTASVEVAPSNNVEGFTNGCSTQVGGQPAAVMSNSIKIPSSQVSSAVQNALGENTLQPIIYDRFIYSNQKSRQYSAGDPIRGDLPIVPSSNDWFRPAANPQSDLRDGAMMSLFGNGKSNAQMLALKSAATGGLMNPGGGANTIVTNNPYMAPGVAQKMSSLSNGGGVHVSAFP